MIQGSEGLHYFEYGRDDLQLLDGSCESQNSYNFSYAWEAVQKSRYLRPKADYTLFLSKLLSRNTVPSTASIMRGFGGAEGLLARRGGCAIFYPNKFRNELKFIFVCF